MNCKNLHKAHPWHGISPGDLTPDEVRCFIEIVPTDTVKYEVDKETGYLSIDRPQKFSNIVPALYGFIPRTLCAKNTAELTNKAVARFDIEGDGDPLDICVLTEKDVTHGDVLVRAIPIGGIRLIDTGQADDKIIAVLKNDAMYIQYADINQLPMAVVRRLVHYFTTYKDIPGDVKKRTEFVNLYGANEAHEVIRRSMKDYEEKFGEYLTMEK
ncbi:MAG: inorganic pyrophosphatase [Bacteroidales bacterium]|nr:inorganic pyrophosphatase [Bacteroidales bacterium]